jgi:hypothetical protein
MTGIGGANEAVLTDPPARPEVAVAATDCIAVLLRAQLPGFSRSLDLLSVLVNTGDEHHSVAVQPLEARQGITGQGCVGAAQVRAIVDVIERSREGVGHLWVRTSAAQRDAGS